MKNWPIKKLGEVADFLDNLRKPVTASQRNPGPYPYYGANGQVGWIDNYLFDEDLVLLAEDGGNFGSRTKPIAYKISGKSWVNNHAHVLRPKESVDIDWLLYNLMFSDVSRFIKGATRAKLNQGDARQIEIPVPPLEDQRRIVKKLEKILAKIEEARTFRQAAVVDTEAMLKSALHKVFDIQQGWKESTIRGVSKEIITGSTPSTKEKSYFGGNIKWVTPGDFNGQKRIKESRQFVSERAVKERKVRLIPNNSVMLVSIGATVGKLGIADGDMATNQQINSIVFDDKKVNPEFGYYCLVNNQKMIINIAVAATLPIINKTKTGELSFCYPENLKEQEKIVAYLDSLSEKVQALQKLQKEQLQELGLLKQSLLHSSFA